MEATTARERAEERAASRRAKPSDSPLGDVAAYAAEFIGTALLTFAIIMAVCTEQDLLVIAIVHAIALMVAIQALGPASGAHFNPAVTTALLALRKITPTQAAVYYGMQVLGALFACLLALILIKDQADAANYAVGAVADDGGLGGSEIRGLIAELLGTFILMFAIMATAVNPRGDKNWAPAVIGAALGLSVLMFGTLTGANFNPARYLGPAIFSGELSQIWVYIIGPIIGAVAAAVAYTALVLVPQDREGERPIDKFDE